MRKGVKIFDFGNYNLGGIPVHRKKVRKPMFFGHLKTFFEFRDPIRKKVLFSKKQRPKKNQFG